VRDFTKLKVWQKAHQLVLDIYRSTMEFPAEERFGLAAHLRKTATSIGSNIAEGCGRGSEAELSRFMSIAAGSASEAAYQLLLARDLGYLTPQAHEDLQTKISEIKKMLNSLIQKLSEAKS
jgi:four helix bundle protein